MKKKWCKFKVRRVCKMLRLISALIIITFFTTALSCLHSSNQIKFGTYRQYTKYHYGDLEIFKDHRFLFDDMRSGSCFAWIKYEGEWTMNKDTLILSRQISWEENPIHILSSFDSISKKINLTFKYEDNEPISNVMVCYFCQHTSDSNCFYTDKKGKLNLPQRKQVNNNDEDCFDVNRLFFKSGYIEGTTSNEKQISDHNVYSIVVERKVDTIHVTETRKFLVSRNNLIFLDSTNKSYYDNWGSFKYLTKEEKKLSDRPTKVKEVVTP